MPQSSSQNPAASPSSLSPKAGKADQVQAMFNRIAGRYDLLNDWISLGMHRRWKQAACQHLQLGPKATALDVCTGTGDLAVILAEIVGKEGHVTGLDFSSEMLGIARHRFAGTSNLTFIQGDAMALPFDNAQFDGCMVAFGLRNVDNIVTTLSEMVRVTKPGGHVVSLDTSPKANLPGFQLYFSILMPLLAQLLGQERNAYQYLFQSTKQFLSPQALRTEFERAGLTRVLIKPVGFGSAAIICGQKPV
jgi:demethylmenaquinone methyltransferase / 2-methoxy-6-polyprenyl-1,4-benzoquinol methylase